MNRGKKKTINHFKNILFSPSFLTHSSHDVNIVSEQLKRSISTFARTALISAISFIRFFSSEKSTVYLKKKISVFLISLFCLLNGDRKLP